MHGLNEELGRHRGRAGKVEMYQSVVYVLCKCPAYVFGELSRDITGCGSTLYVGIVFRPYIKKFTCILNF